MAINFLDGITVDGNVGIGTTSPSHKLEVNGDTAIAAINGATTNGKPMLFVGESNAYGVGFRWDAGLSLDIVDFDNTAPTTTSGTKIGHFKIRDEQFYWKGNVGVGTTAPAEKLDVSGNIKITGVGNGLKLDSLGSAGSGGIATINNYETAVYTGRGSAGFAVIGNANIRLGFGDKSTTSNADLLINTSGQVGIGTVSPGAKLHVRDTSGSTSTVKISAASNDANYGYLTMTDYSANTAKLTIGTTYGYSTNKDTITLFNGNVGIGTTSFSDKLYVSNGMIRVEGTGCGIRMPDTSGNPLLALTTDQNTFAGCNIVNGWGNSLNTGVGVGTTRSDGTAFQVRTGITLSSGIATSSGTQRLVVYGSGGTKITKSLSVGAITPSTTTGRIDASNDVVAFSTSDVRLKNNIKTIDKALDKVNSIQGIEFDWIEKEEVHGNSGHDIGVIAQEIEKILPDVVTTRENGYKAVKYEKIVPLLIEAIKDLSKQVDGLKRLI